MPIEICDVAPTALGALDVWSVATRAATLQKMHNEGASLWLGLFPVKFAAVANVTFVDWCVNHGHSVAIFASHNLALDVNWRLHINSSWALMLLMCLPMS